MPADAASKEASLFSGRIGSRSSSISSSRNSTRIRNVAGVAVMAVTAAQAVTSAYKSAVTNVALKTTFYFY